MPVELIVPEMGESVTEIYVGKWRKSEGDTVEQDEELVELESEKATLDLRAPAAGVLAKILKQSGEPAEVGEVIGRIEQADGANRSKAEAAPQDGKHKSEKKSVTSEEDAAPPKKGPEKVKSAPAREEKPVAKKRPEDIEEKPEARGSQKAKEITEQTESKSEESPAETEDQAESSRGEERVPMSPIRRRIAVRLVEAQRNAALLTTFNEIDMSAVKELRSQHGAAFERRHQIKLGFMSFFVKAAIESLRQCPALNATIEDDEIVYRRYYDIGVAISTDKGLVVPVLRNAERLSFAKIEKAIDAFATRAREGQLKVEELQGGTFTITNGGIFGSLLSTPIVNPPQSGVLGMHVIQDRPIAHENQVLIKPMMYVALTYDHRIVDGREAVTFLRRIKESIEEPARLLIEV